jgi:hypothetical protein
MTSIFDTLEEIGNGSLEIEIGYKYWPGEPMVLFYKNNGDGYPGSPSYAELRCVRVLRWDVGDDERPRTDASIWGELDKIATGIVESKWEDYYEELCLEESSERCGQ